MEDVIYPLKHIPYQFLLILNLDRCIGHQKWIWYSHIDPLNLIIITSTIALIIVSRTTYIKSWFFIGRDAMIFMNSSIICLIA
jgi:hypothetical protein